MFISEMEKTGSLNLIGRVVKDSFGFELSETELNPNKAAIMLEDICIQISDFRNSEQYFLGERNAVYMSMLATASYLTEYLREKKTLVEKNPTRRPDPDAQAQMYQHGIKKGAGHAVDTTRKFVPHVAGSAISAFTSGLKGQALQSEHGRVKITDLEKELEMIDPKNPAQVKTFVSKQIKGHFQEYSAQQQGVISNYIQTLYKNATSGNVVITPEVIAKQIADLPGHPFKAVNDPAKRKELVDYFMSIYTSAKAASKQVPARLAGTQGQPTTNTMIDVASALLNLGYTKKSAVDAVKQVVDKNKALSDNFDGLLRAAQTLVRK